VHWQKSQRHHTLNVVAHLQKPMNREGKLYKIVTFLDEYAVEMLSICVNGLGYALIGILYEIDRLIFWKSVHSQTIGLILLIIIFSLNIYLGIKVLKKSKSKEKLENDKRELGVKIQSLENSIDEIQRNSLEIFNEHLAALFYKLDLTECERISFYKFQDDKFHIVGRYSINPKLNERNRKYYPANEGLISLAWQIGEFHINSGIPEFVNGNKQAYYTYLRNLSDIPVDTIKNIKMKSRSFYLKAFTDSRGIQRNSIIAFESLNSGEFEIENIEPIINEEQAKLISFVERLQWDLPNLETANNQGF
jgi:hypothetical protein